MLWDSKKIDKKLVSFCSSYDKEADLFLFKYAKKALLFHIKNLKDRSILEENEFKALKEILDKIKKDNFNKNFEDVQTYLLENIKEEDKTLYAKARAYFSRNEHSLNTEVFFVKDSIKYIKHYLFTIKTSLKSLKKYQLPWLYQTHFREGTITTTDKWISSYIDWISFLEKNLFNFKISPLFGTGPGGGSSIYTKEISPLFSQHLRSINQINFVYLILEISSLISKFSWDVILYSMLNHLNLEFSFGSSAMPHKKNPDPFEIIRANHSIISSKFNSLVSLHNLPTGYHRDFQQGKVMAIESFLIIEKDLKILPYLINKISFNKKELLKLKSKTYLKSFEDMSKSLIKGELPNSHYKKWDNQ